LPSRPKLERFVACSSAYGMLDRVPHARAHTVVLNLMLAAVYVVVASLGLRVDAVGGFATLVWPATGISLVALLFFGYRAWPGIAAGAFITNLGIGAPPAVACGIALGNTLEALAGAWTMKRLTGGYPSFGRVRDVLALVGLAAVASTAISATIGVASLRLGGLVQGANVLETWRAWWLGDAMGDLVLVPLLLGMAARGDSPKDATSRSQVSEGVALGLLLVATNFFVFGMREGRESSMLREAYLVFPLLVWAGLRFGARGAAWANFVVSAVAIAGTAAGRGPFQMATLSQSLLHLQAFMLIIAVTTLILGSASDERRLAIGLRDSLISLASHELRTPLTSLQLRIQLLARNARAETLSKERFSRDAAAAEGQVKRMARLVDDLLDISRIMSGRFRLDVEDVDLGGFVREVVDRCPEPQRELVGVRAEGEPIVGRWDRMRIDQIVSNLLSNALKYGESNPIEISVDREGDRARMVVRDHGVGIAAADLPRIFERFERAATRHVGGFGLGLWIVRQVVDTIGGTIAVESRLGSGSVFIVELPLEPTRGAPGAAPGGYPRVAVRV
jgi:signal transduction histidine kinase